MENTKKITTCDNMHMLGRVVKFVDCDKNSKNVIYQITTFPQKRMYVGSTIMTLCSRLHDHAKDSRKPYTSRLIEQAIKEAEYVQVNVLYQAPPTMLRKELRNLENVYIRDLRDRILLQLPREEHCNIAEYLLNMRPDGRIFH